MGVPRMDIHGEVVIDCPANHASGTAVIDSRGDHGVNCVNSKTVRIRGHNELRDLCVNAGVDAGCVGAREPPTGRLLGDAYSEQDIAVRFPGSPTAASIAHFAKVQLSLTALEVASSQQRPAALRLVQSLLDTAPKGHGLRLDGELVAPDGSDMWFDVTMYHDTSAGRRDSQLKWLADRAEAEFNAFQAGTVLPGIADRSMSPAMQKAVATKHHKYAPVVYTAALQRYQRPGYKKRPLFLAAAVSHTGEMSPGMFDLVEWVTGHRKRAARKGGPQYDGRAPNGVAADFRKNLKDAIQVTAARTIGHYIAATGLCY